MTPDSARAPDSAVNGLLLLNKPAGLTSNQALQKVKRLLKAKKAGHTGSLDPAATGMLPLCFGEATKVCAYILDADKTYRVVACLGASTDTGDADGEVVATAAIPVLSREQWLAIFTRFTGEIEQVPPMYSALKVDGKRLYELARKGQTIERRPRRILIHELQLIETCGNRLAFRVRCSKGTYVRTLVEDLAREAGTVAYTAALHRETVGDFRQGDMLDMSGVEHLAEDEPQALRDRLLAPDQALMRWPACHLAADAARWFRDGRAVVADGPAALKAPGPVRVYGPERQFLGVGEAGSDGRLAPRRIFRPAL